MKRLFDENDGWTEEALDLAHRAESYFRNIFDEYLEAGYSVREISHVLNSAIGMTECERHIGRGRRREKEALSEENDDEELCETFPVDPE